MMTAWLMDSPTGPNSYQLSSKFDAHKERTFIMIKHGHPIATSPLAAMPISSTDLAPNRCSLSTWARTVENTKSALGGTKLRVTHLEPEMRIDVPRPRSGGFQVYGLAGGALESVTHKQRAVSYPPSAIPQQNKKEPLLSTEYHRRLSRQVMRLTLALVGWINGNLQQAPRIESLHPARGERSVVYLICLWRVVEHRLLYGDTKSQHRHPLLQLHSAHRDMHIPSARRAPNSGSTSTERRGSM